MLRAGLSTVLVSFLTASISAGDSVVVFNEVMFQPENGDTVEWVEVHNQMGVDVEMSNWSIEGLNYTFPTNTIIAGGAYLVVASDADELRRRTGRTNLLGPFSGRLDNSGERLELRNHNQRVMDELRYEPEGIRAVAAAGTGFTFAKMRPTLGSAEAVNWTHSAERGGTPGGPNFSASRTAGSVQISEVSSVTNTPFRVEVVNRATTAADLSGYELVFSRELETAFRVPSGRVLDAGGFFVFEPAVDGYRPRADESLFLFAPGRTSLVDVITLQATTQAREAEGKWYYPPTPTFGAANSALVPPGVVINEIMYRNQPIEPRPAGYEELVVVPMDGTWRFNQSGAVPANWQQPGFNDASWNSGPALLAAETAAVPEQIRTPLTLGRISYYFRSEFTFSGNTNGAEFFIEHVIDDGAIFYLNGREIYRFNMPAGPVNSSTTATPGVSDAALTGPVVLPAAALVPGRNVLAVEVHQGSTGSSDVVFGCRVGLRVTTRPAAVFAESTENWVELFNKGGASVDLTGWRIEGADFTFPTNTSLAAGEYMVVGEDGAKLRARFPGIRVLGDFGSRLSRRSHRIALVDVFGNAVDEVRYFDSAPWPEFADGQGASLELRDPHADNSKAESWAASREHGEWREYSYSAVAAADRGPTRWNEFVFGLLDAGEVLLDDFAVIENPGTAGARMLLRNGGFENGAASWRFLGTHRNATVINDSDNPANRVLRLVADGPTEHMHNHVETTLTNNVAVQNGNTYLIRFRAKMLAGCNKLNTRLYFNRVARVTALERPESGGTPGRGNSAYVENLGPSFSEMQHTPVVPSASQSVEVSVRADDPHGITTVDLWSGVNGTNWTRTAMVRVGDRHAATIPARGASSVVQFYIEAKDSRGATSFYPAEGPNSRAVYKVNDGQALSSRTHNMRVIMLPRDASTLHASTNVMSNGRSLCTVIYNQSEVFYNCGIHLQGSERGRNDPNRVGFTISFPADQLFRGVNDTVTLDRSGGWSGRGGRQDEILLRHIINQAGDSPDMYNDIVRVLAPLNTHTGSSLLVMAKYDDEYIDGSVHGKDGSLYKLELIYYPTTSVGGNPEAPKLPQPDQVTGQDIGNLGDDPEAYRWFFLAENRPWRNDYTRMIDLAQAFSLSGGQLESRTAELMNMEQWTRVFAFKTLSGDPDTYGWGLTHNQLIYIPTVGKALTFPWDLDFAWTRSPTDTLNVGSRIGQIMHGTPAYHRLFLGHVEDILRSSFSTNYLARWATHYASLAGQNYSGAMTWIGQKATSARGQLPALSGFGITNWSSPELLVNGTEVLLQGRAPYTMKRLQRNNEPPGGGFRWSGRDNWETRAPLVFGPNTISLKGYNFRNEPVATNVIVVTSTQPYGRADTDGDGMPDEWEAVNGLNAAMPDGETDADGDGLSNLGEYLAGTVPADAASRLELRTDGNSEQLVLSFDANGGRVYRIQCKAALDGAWLDVLTVPAAAQDREIRHFDVVNADGTTATKFYRVVLDAPAPE